ncbi:nucleoside/nucleotide kinase family protein [Paenarthrobacter sp. JL.01a]|uniref:nucleoside/nucleotide kinase family protein n=1 Tax=Paenarthrobacter sp. JL.01a TaxID=2979324 RepID=UPI0021C99220|nr:nucleoside/nucleotide kinase family protein [Paenarthrobacter sp. JL.01a]UXM93644.1 nucleoside/nucleotide kinase family protein [Paenarthrobacter sp. JL.01a]
MNHLQPVNPGNTAQLAEHLRRRALSGNRLIVGLAGPPGAGKSTIAEGLRRHLGRECAIVPMDGFHLANAIIEGTELRERKGAIDTFDVGGYLSLLARLRLNEEDVIYAPTYRRGLEEPIAASIAVPRLTEIVITEGNYLLAGDGPWARVRSYLDEAWFVELPSETRISRLIQRHVDSGMEPAAAEAWAKGPDEANAKYVESTKASADLIITCP